MRGWLLAWLAGCGGADPPAEPPSPATEPDAIYFVLVDRFANGDPANDGAIDPSDPQAFHGGDLAGLRAQLDHIQGLGFDAVWVSPVFEMRTDKLEQWGAYHGYWVRDLSKIEPRFGDEAELKALADELHRRGMRLILDVVWNHVSFDAPLRAERPEWFHPSRPITDWNDPVQVVTHEVHGLPDLAQENPEVYAHLRAASLGWVERVQPDGFRVDAVRHMPLDFQKRLGDELRAASKRPFSVIGEVFDGDPSRLDAAWRAGGFDGVFDFPLRYALIDTVCKGAPPARLAAILAADDAYADPRRLVTFLDNHDVSRVMSECGGDADKVGVALDLLTSLRGTPCVTWGTEIGLEGMEEPHNRADMRFGVAHPLEVRLRAALGRRARSAALREGSTTLLHIGEHALVFARRAGDEALIVAWNTDSRPLEIPGLGSFAPGFSATPSKAALPEVGPRRVRLRVDPGALAAGEAPFLVGTGPRLGSWQPARGLPLQRDAQGWYAELEVQAPGVVEGKWVARGPGGERWAEGANRWAFVPAGEGVFEAAW